DLSRAVDEPGDQRRAERVTWNEHVVAHVLPRKTDVVLLQFFGSCALRAPGSGFGHPANTNPVPSPRFCRRARARVEGGAPRGRLCATRCAHALQRGPRGPATARG